ncbi:MAG TPA: PKD domain-containing protein [Nocardioides sp.]|nr:PKD domain-containing protein [Nocardioides sp.]
MPARFLRRSSVALLASIACLSAALVAVPTDAQPGHHRLHPSAVPAITPNILDGRTYAIAEVGTKVFVGGTFTTTQNPGTSAPISTPFLFKYDRLTGVVDTTFAPQLDAQVNAIVPSPDGSALYVGGAFKKARTTNVRNVVKIDTTTGALITAFKNPSPNGTVLDLALVGDRLFVAGSFTTMATVPHGGLAALNATTGAVDEYMGIDVATNHNWPSGAAKAPVGVAKLAASPDGSKLVAIGNFKTADGLDRDQVMMIQLGETAATVHPDWKTLRYTPACANASYDYYVRDVDFSPDGSYFVVAATGAGFQGTLCDSAARFDTAVLGQAVEPVWVAYTGQDTLLSVAVTDTAVYVGGHQKWLNAVESGADQQAGQVPRPGLAALDPINGVPLSWNPGRHPRGVGAEELLATDEGLYVGSDTQYIGNQLYRRERLAFFPIDGGTAPVSQPDPVLPRTVYRFNGTAMTAFSFTGSSATTPVTIPNSGGQNWSSMRGAFMIGNKLVYGWNDGKMYYRTFDGSAYGPAVLIDPYNDPTWSNVTIGASTTTYRGRVPTLYTQMNNVVGMAYSDGRIYYWRSGALYWRWFSPESMIVGAKENAISGAGLPSLRTLRNLFFANGNLYAGATVPLLGNELYRLSVNDGVASGGWVKMSGSGIDGSSNWSGGTLFIGPLANLAPVPSISASCSGQVCTFDGAASSDADGTVLDYQWDFGDGGAASGAQAEHGYATPGTYTVSLTVTDDDGAPASTTTDVVIEGASSDIGFRDSTGKVTNATSIVSPIPASAQEGDGLVAVASVASTTVPAAPAGWTQVGSPVVAGSLTTVVWQRVATATDPGKNVNVALGAAAVKATLTVLAYSGTDPGGPVAAIAGEAETTTLTTHQSPFVTTPGDWVVTVWADRSSTTTTFTEPAGTTLRQRLIGTGGGHVDSLVVDTGGPVAAGSYGGQVAVTDTPSRGTNLSIALK